MYTVNRPIYSNTSTKPNPNPNIIDLVKTITTTCQAHPMTQYSFMRLPRTITDVITVQIVFLHFRGNILSKDSINFWLMTLYKLNWNVSRSRTNELPVVITETASSAVVSLGSRSGMGWNGSGEYMYTFRAKFTDDGSLKQRQNLQDFRLNIFPNVNKLLFIVLYNASTAVQQKCCAIFRLVDIARALW